MFYYFKKSKIATEMQKRIYAVYGEDAMTNQMYQKQFVKFLAGDFSLDDAPWLGRPIEVDSDQIETLIENNQLSTSQEIADILKIPKINKVIGENEKCVFYFTKKKLTF